MKILTIAILSTLLFYISILIPSTASANRFERDIRCLAVNIYYEARGEPDLGKKMVAYVTLNRVRDSRFPNSVCNVVYQPNQFSWTQHKKEIHNWALYHKIKELAADTYFMYLDNRVDNKLSKYGKNLLYFSSSGHLDKMFKRAVVIQNLIFYSDEEIDKETKADN